jgi:prepilin-type N-terminal cleavage/methylation domain-containing protein
MKLSKRSQSGFTLVEIAIVLVIIGLLLGGVLKGQQMIENSRIKSILTAFNGVSSAYNSYQDRYQSLPGDELLSTLQARGWTGAAPGLNVTLAGNGDGVFEEAVADTFLDAGVAGATEQGSMWQVLRAAGFLAGDPSAVALAALPITATGGLIGMAQSPYGMAGTSVCASALTTNQASGVDTLIDGSTNNVNGNNIGSARGTNYVLGAAPVVSAATPASLAYNVTAAATANTPWIICKTL